MSLTSHQSPLSGVHRHKTNRDEYYLLSREGLLPRQGRVELIEGEIFEMSPAGPFHSSVVDEIYDLIRDSIPSKTAKVRNEKAIVLSDFSEPEPDIAIVKPGDFRTSHPTSDDVFLLIEVSQSSIEYDRETKLPVYAASGIPEVWIVDLNIATIEVYQNPEPSGFATKLLFDSKGNDLKMTPIAFPDCPFDLSKISLV